MDEEMRRILRRKVRRYVMMRRSKAWRSRKTKEDGHENDDAKRIDERKGTKANETIDLASRRKKQQARHFAVACLECCPSHGRATTA